MNLLSIKYPWSKGLKERKKERKKERLEFLHLSNRIYCYDSVYVSKTSFALIAIIVFGKIPYRGESKIDFDFTVCATFQSNHTLRLLYLHVNSIQSQKKNFHQGKTFETNKSGSNHNGSHFWGKKSKNAILVDNNLFSINVSTRRNTRYHQSQWRENVIKKIKISLTKHLQNHQYKVRQEKH